MKTSYNILPVISKKEKVISVLKGKYDLYIMGGICFLFVLVFSYLPLFGWALAFFDYSPGFRLDKIPFVGLRWFIMAVNMPELLPVLRNTLVISFLNLFCSPIPVVLALLLSEMRFQLFKKFVQTTTTFPNFISWVLVFSVFYAMFSPTDGVINKVLVNLNIINNPMDPLADGDNVWLIQTAISLWKSAGFSTILYLASLSGINPELFDAAEVDGAGRFRKIIHIKIPGLYPIYFTLLVLAIGQLLNNGFEQYYMFYNAPVAEKITVLDYYIYKIGINMGNYSLSTAIGICKTLIGVILLTSANIFSKHVRGVSIL